MKLKHRLRYKNNLCALEPVTRESGSTDSCSKGIALTEAPQSVPLRLKGFDVGCRAMNRLASMGLLPGETITVLKNSNSGPVLLLVKGAHIALGRGIASRIFVEMQN